MSYSNANFGAANCGLDQQRSALVIGMNLEMVRPQRIETQMAEDKSNTEIVKKAAIN